MKSLIAEFEEQSFTKIIFPHKNSDWSLYLEEAQVCFINIINTIKEYQSVLIVCHNIQEVKKYFAEDARLIFIEFETNDTWARDCSALTILDVKEIKLLDFKFNAWGGKFDSQKDNLMSRSISNIYSAKLETIDFVLEGGAVESNGDGFILTTSACMLNKNRNPHLSKEQITQKLNGFFGSTEILYLNHGYLAGDDTDSHIDTLARFISKDSIMYVKCEDSNDEHFNELKLMEDELKNFAKLYDFKLIALPMSEAVIFEDERLPATYANFLFVNGAVIVPTYRVKQDAQALEIFRDTFKDREIVGVNCRTLIKQHGSLHCVTMNFARGVRIN